MPLTANREYSIALSLLIYGVAMISEPVYANDSQPLTSRPTQEIRGSDPVRQFLRNDIEFDADGVKLRGWLYQPVNHGERLAKHPAIVMTGGYGTTKEMYTDLFAEKFAAAGFLVVLYDPRGFGSSGGTPRREINPWQQVEDFRHAITYVSSLSLVDTNRIGIWGSSYSGGHAIVVAATDRRVKCVAVQVPTINGTKAALRRVYGDAENALLARLAEDRQRRAKGEAPAVVRIMGNADSGAIYRTKDAVDWYTTAYNQAPGQIPEVTLRSIEFARAYNPGNYIEQVSPTPLMIVIAERDYVTPTDLSLDAYRNALEPKSLMIIPGAGHFDPYVKDFDTASTAELKWFSKYLGSN